MDRNKLILMLLAVFVATSMYAQIVTITGTITHYKEGDPPIKIYISAPEKLQENSAQVCDVKEGTFATQVDAPGHFLSVVVIEGGSQYIVPYYKGEGMTPIHLSLHFTPESLILMSPDNDNQALETLREVIGRNTRRLWIEGKGLEEAEIRAMLAEVKHTSDSISTVEGIAPEVRRYLQIWGYNTVYELAQNLPFILGDKIKEINVDVAKILPVTHSVLDDEVASYFPNTSRVILSSLGRASLDEHLVVLYRDYRTPSVRDNVADMLIRDFIAKFDYSSSYEQGLIFLEDRIKKYNLSSKYVGEFKKRKATIAGSPFPQEVTLTDLDDKPVDFSKFRGKYVYIDMWASWCAPCMKEIPYMKQLEEEVKNKNVVFLSLSIDKDKKAWKKKVNSLGLKGYQVIDVNNDLTQALNVSGIPFFVIYDKDGKLYKYGASRPSDPTTKKLLESLP